MNPTLSIIKSMLNRRDVKVMMVCILAGCLTQVAAAQYLKRHPEMVMTDDDRKLLFDELRKKKKKPKKNPRRGRRILRFRGGGNPIVAFLIKKLIINHLANLGIATGAAVGSSILGSNLLLNSRALQVIVRDAVPGNFLDKKRFITVDGVRIWLPKDCDENLRHLFRMLQDPDVTDKRKRQLTKKFFRKQLDLTTNTGKVNFILCVVFILWLFSTQSLASFDIMMSNLIRAIREGRISKAAARAIIRRLRKEGVYIDPELVEAAS